MALARLDVPGVMLYGGSIPPGRFKGRDVTIQEVFEAVGAHAAGKITDEELARARGRRQPGRRRLRRPVHRQHDGDGLRGARHLARWARRWSPRRTPTKAEVAYEAGELVMDVLAARPAAAATSSRASRSRTRSPRSPRAAARPTACCTCSRSRARPASTLDIDDFDRISERTPLLCDLKPGGHYVATDLLRRRRRAASSLKRLREARRPPRGRDHGHRQTDRRARRRGAARPTGQRGRPPARRPDQADRRPRDPARQPRARGLRREARRPRAPPPHAARRACSRARRPRWRPSPHGGIKAGDVVVIRNEGPAGGPGMREMLAVTGGDRRRGARRAASRCSPTGASPAPRTASWPATSRPRRSAAARSPRSATATRSRSTSTAAASTSTLADDEIAAPRRGLRAAGEPRRAPACWRSTRSSCRAPPRAPSRADAERALPTATPAAADYSAANASTSALNAAGRSSIATWPVSKTTFARVGDQALELVGVARPGRGGRRRPRRSASGSRSRPSRSRIG